MLSSNEYASKLASAPTNRVAAGSEPRAVLHSRSDDAVARARSRIAGPVFADRHRESRAAVGGERMIVAKIEAMKLSITEPASVILIEVIVRSEAENAHAIARPRS